MLSLRMIRGGLMALPLAVMVVSMTTAQAPEPVAVSEQDAKWLLPDAEIIVKINIKQMMTSDLMKKGGLEQLKEAINSNEQAKALLTAAGLDVTKDVDSIVACASGSSAKDAKARVVINGRFDPDKIHNVIKKDDKIKIAKEGAITLYEVPTQQDQTLFAAFANKNTLVMTQSKESTIDAVKNGGKKAVTLGKEMRTAMSKFTGKESMTMVLVVNDEMKKQIANAPRIGEQASKLQTLTASITLSDAVALNLRGITGEAKSASQLGKLLEGLKAATALAGEGVPQAVLDIIDAVKVTSDKESVKVDLKVTKEMIEKAAKGGI
jgi:hypothetical protein